MRFIATALCAFALFLASAFAQTVDGTQDEAVKNAEFRAKLIKVLEAHPDQLAVARLENDITTRPGQEGLVIVQTPAFGRITDAEGVIGVILGVTMGAMLSGGLAIPDQFFELEGCRKGLIVEGTGLAYEQFVIVSNDLIAILPEMTQLRGRLGEAVAQQRVQELSRKLADIFEVPMLKIIDHFGAFAFANCSRQDLEEFFPGFPATDQGAWIAAAKLKGREALSAMRNLPAPAQ